MEDYAVDGRWDVGNVPAGRAQPHHPASGEEWTRRGSRPARQRDMGVVVCEWGLGGSVGALHADAAK